MGLPDTSQLIDELCRIARSAGETIMAYYESESGVAVRAKADRSPV